MHSEDRKKNDSRIAVEVGCQIREWMGGSSYASVGVGTQVKLAVSKYKLRKVLEVSGYISSIWKNKSMKGGENCILTRYEQKAYTNP